MTKRLTKEAPQHATSDYILTSDAFYAAIKNLRIPFYHAPGDCANSRSSITEQELQEFLKQYKRSDFNDLLRQLYRETASQPPAPTAVEAGKSQLFSHFLLAYWNQLRSELGSPTTVPNDARIIRPPGSFLNRVSEFLFSQKTLDHVIAPIISDMQVEYCEALAANRRIKAAWIRLRGYWTFFKAIGLYSVLKTFIEMWRKVTSV